MQSQATAPEPANTAPERADEFDAAFRLQFAVGRLARLLRREIDSDLTPSQLSVLSAVRREGPLSLGELAESERVAPPTITRVVAKLEEAGYLERLPDPEDRRVVRVRITGKAEQLVADARVRKSRWVLDRLDRLPAGQRRRLLGAVEAFEQLADLE